MTTAAARSASRGSSRPHAERAPALKIARWGNCAALRLPSAKARESGLTIGTAVTIAVVPEGVLIRPVRARPTLRDMLDRITPRNVHGEIDTGGMVGRERV
jgi:antitoxin MazE